MLYPPARRLGFRSETVRVAQSSTPRTQDGILGQLFQAVTTTLTVVFALPILMCAGGRARTDEPNYPQSPSAESGAWDHPRGHCCLKEQSPTDSQVIASPQTELLSQPKLSSPIVAGGLNWASRNYRVDSTAEITIKQWLVDNG